MPRWWPRSRAGVSLLYQDGGRRLPACASPILFKMSEQRRPPPESERGLRESGCSRAPQQGLGGAAAASAPVRSWQTLSPVGAQNLPPETLKQHSTTFPRVTKIMCAAQGRRLGPCVAQAFPRRRGEAGGWSGASGADTPRPTPLSLGIGHVFPWD